MGVEAIPRAVVNGLAQDRTGFLWVATGDGLVRFDGYRFSPKERDDAAPADRNLGWIHALLPTRDGRLWMGTEAQGLARHDPASDRIDIFPPAASTARAQPLVHALAEGADGTVWVGLDGGGLKEAPPGGGPVLQHRAGPGPGELPDDRVLALLVCRDGHLWVGTSAGLVRRPRGGTAFEPVFGNTLPSLQERAVQALFQASDGQLWVGTRQGDLARVDPVSGRGQWLTPPAGSLGRQAGAPPRAGAVTGFAEPGALEPVPRRVWVARSTGIDLHGADDGRPLKALRHDPSDPHSLGANHVTALLVDRVGWVWVGSLGGGLQRHNPHPTALTLRGGDADPGSPFHQPSAHSLLVLNSPQQGEEVWVGTHDAGVVVLDSALQWRSELRPLLMSTPLGQTFDDVLPPGGLRSLPAVRGAAGALPGRQAPPGSPLPRVEALAQAPDGGVWLASDAWLQQFDRQRRPLRQLWHGAGVTHQLRVGRDGTLWAATQGGLYRWRPGQTSLQALAAQAPELSASAGAGQGAAPLVGEVFALAEAADGALWVGSFHGLWRLAPGVDLLSPVASAADASLARRPVIGLLFDRQNRLWLDTAVAGLHRMTHWDGQQARFDRISERLGVIGLPFGVNLLEDQRGRIWTHLHVYDPARDRIDALTAADGQRLGTGWFRSYAQRADGRMLFGGSRGVLAVQPADFDPVVEVAPLVVSEVRINGQRVPAAGLNGGAGQAQTAGLVLQPGQRSLSLELAALEYSDPGRLRYAWRLQGFDSDWISAGADQRSATYANLAPGDYVLRARATNRSGVWGSEELAIPIQVLPAWWQHELTLLAAGLLALLLVLGGMQWRTRQLRHRQLQLARTVKERTAQLEELAQALQRESAALKEASLTDPLTGLRNRRFLSEHIDADVAVSLRRWQDHLLQGRPRPAHADLLLFLIDIDHFKQVNDLRGHDAGDAVIRQMRGRLQGVFRDTDYMVRWGGEEFLIVARGGSRLHAADLAERARQAVAAEPFVLPDGERLRCSCSLGFACFPLSVQFPAAVGWSSVASLADAALYRAKAHGRNAWAGVLEARELDAAELALRRPGPVWLADGSLLQQSSWELPLRPPGQDSAAPP